MPQSVTLYSLLKKENESFTYSSNIEKLDKFLKGGRGFKQSGIYDISCVSGMHGVGEWELLFNLMISFFGKQPRGKVLIIKTNNKIPWFKFERLLDFKTIYKSNIEIIEVETLVQILVLFKSSFKDSNNFLDNFGFIIIESFNFLLKTNLNQIRNEYNLNLISGQKRDFNGKIINQSGNINPVIKFNQIIRLLFEFFKKLTCKNNSVLITTGPLKTFSQKIMSDVSNNFSGENEEIPYFTQRILVPVISLKSELSSYYTNRIILYRDWVLQKSDGSITSGLSNQLKEKDGIKECFNLLENDKMRCLPHYLCHTPNSILEETFKSGWFRVSDDYSIIDGENNETDNELHGELPQKPGLVENKMDSFWNETQLLDDEVPNSQSGF